MTDDPIGDALRREFASSFVPFDSAHADSMLSAVHMAGTGGPRWVAPLAAAAVVAVVGGGAAVIGLPGSHDRTPAGGSGPAASPTSSTCYVGVAQASAIDLPMTGVAVPGSARAGFFGPLSDVPSSTVDRGGSGRGTAVLVPPADSPGSDSLPVSDSFAPSDSPSGSDAPPDAGVSAIPSPIPLPITMPGGCVTGGPGAVACVAGPVPTPGATDVITDPVTSGYATGSIGIGTAPDNTTYYVTCGVQGDEPAPSSTS